MVYATEGRPMTDNKGNYVEGEGDGSGSIRGHCLLVSQSGYRRQWQGRWSVCCVLPLATMIGFGRRWRAVHRVMITLQEWSTRYELSQVKQLVSWVNHEVESQWVVGWVKHGVESQQMSRVKSTTSDIMQAVTCYSLCVTNTPIGALDRVPLWVQEVNTGWD